MWLHYSTFSTSMATIGWIDFSREDRNRIGSVLDLLTPEGMVDELGLGTLRDALANQMFPGFSTIQTRPRYFFIVPYILYEYQRLKPARRTKSASKYLEEQEYEVMWQLGDRYGHKQDGNGVMGITKYRPDKIARRPSGIYWNGLNTYNFIQTADLPLETFLRQTQNKSLASLLGDEDDEDAEFDNEFRIRVPWKKNWRNNLDLDLRPDEAQFFADRITSIAKGRLVSELLHNDKLWRLYSSARNFMQFVKSALNLRLGDNLRNLLVLAHDFSELMYGVHLAYNCQLQRKVYNNACWDDDWRSWKKGLREEMVDFGRFNPEEVFANGSTTRESTKAFIRHWWQEAQSDFRDLKLRDRLILQQEGQVKGSKARLQWGKIDDVPAREWIGLQYLDYRFNVGKRMINDIRNPVH